MITRTAFYATADMLPPRGVRVRVIWDARVFEAALVVRPGKRFETCWLTLHKGAAVYLPLDAEDRIAAARRVLQDERPKPWLGYHGLGVHADDPEFWAPLDPASWKLPLPAPAFFWDEQAAPMLWAERASFDAVAAAAEMEADRETARAQAESKAQRGCGSAPEAPAERQWWLDPMAVTRSKSGAVTPREAEGRIMRAFLTERWVDLDTCGWLSDGGDEAPLRIEPTGKDQDDMLTALDWLRALPGREHEKILRLRGQTPALTWRRIGEHRCMSHEMARTLYREAIAVLTIAANGKVTPQLARHRARIDALREANRRYKRGTADA